jgi:hypothetical protein
MIYVLQYPSPGFVPPGHRGTQSTLANLIELYSGPLLLAIVCSEVAEKKRNTERQKTYVMSIIPQERRYHIGHSHHCFHPGLNRRCHAT